MPTPGVLHHPVANAQLKRGFDKLADLLALTLGPVQGVVYSQSRDETTPELLTDAASIARRMLQLPDRAEDVGAMLLRNLVWRMHMRVGDGAATAAVLAQAILDGALRHRAAGANAMALRDGIQAAGRAAVNALETLSQPVAGEEDLTALAESITGEPDLSLVLGEIFDLLGPDAHVTVEDYVAPYLEREYYEGGRWRGRLASPYFISDAPTQRGIITGCAVALLAGTLHSAAELAPLLQAVANSGERRLALIAHEIQGEALATLVMNHRQERLQIVAAGLSRPPSKRLSDMEDLATLTGATLLSAETGRALDRVTASDLGAARRVEAGSDDLVVVGDGRQAVAIRERIATLRSRQASSFSSEDDERHEMHLRLARLSGGMVTLKIGAHSKVERAAQRQKAEKGLKVLPLALREGVVPGGGVAYLDCIPAVQQLALDGQARWGGQILARALEAPFRRIAQNGNATAPGLVLAEARRRGPGFGYDVLSGEIVNMTSAGILDATSVVRSALQTAISGAIMALTTDAVVFKRRPQSSFEP